MKPYSMLLLACGMAATLPLSGCGGSTDSVQMAAARLSLQLGDPQKAIDALADEDPSAEHHYLKAIALNRLSRTGPAMAEIDLALEAEPDVAKYKGLKLKFELFQTKVEAIDEMIQLHEDNRSNPVVSLFSIYAYQAKTLRLAAIRKVRAAAAHKKRAREALEVCVQLVSEMPEYHVVVLNFTIRENLKKDAELLANQLIALDPDNPSLVQYKLQVLLLTDKIGKAVELAKSIYYKNGRSQLAAVLYSQVLSKADASEDYDREMRSLFQDHPRSVETVTNYGIYLARSNRMGEAIKAIQYAIRQHKLIAPRSQLISSAISLPLEVGNAALAEQQLERYRLQLNDTFLIRLFEGRIHYLNKNYGEALDKLQSIVEADRRMVGGARPLAAEALKWIQIIMNDETVSEQMRIAAELIQKMKLGIAVPQTSDGDGSGSNGGEAKDDKAAGDANGANQQ